MITKRVICGLLLLLVVKLLIASESFQGDGLLKKARDFKISVVYDSSEFYYINAIEWFKLEKDWGNYTIASVELGNLYRITNRADSTWLILNNLKVGTEFDIKEYPHEYAEYLHLKSSLVGGYGKFIEAISILDTVINIHNSISDSDTLLAKTYNNIGAYNYFISRYDEAMIMYEKALETELKKKNPIREDVATYNQNVGTIYTIRGDYDKSLEYYAKNLDLNKDKLDSYDPEIGHIYYNLAVNYSRLGQHENALKYCKLNERIVLEYGKLSADLGYLYSIIGTIYKSRSDLVNARIYLNKAKDILEKTVTSNHSSLLLTHYRIGHLDYIDEDYDNAILNLQKSKGLKYSFVEILRLKYLALAYQANNDTINAKKYFKKAINYAETSLSQKKISHSSIYSSFADFLISSKSYEEAEVYILKAIEASKKLLSEDVLLHLAYNTYGLLMEEQNNLDKAKDYYEKSIQYNLKRFNIRSEYFEQQDSVRQIRTYMFSLLRKANVCSKLYQNTNKVEYLQESLDSYNLALEVFDDIKIYTQDENQITFTKWNTKSFYHVFQDIDVLRKQISNNNLVEISFKFAEKFKANTLLMNVKNIEALRYGGIPDSLQEKEKLLSQRINGYRRLIYEESSKEIPTTSKIRLWESKLFDVSKEHIELKDHLKENYQAYYDLNFNKDVISIDEIQKNIEPDQVLLEYVLTDDQLFTFVIDTDTVLLESQEIDSSFVNNLKVLEGITNTDFSTHRLAHYKETIQASFDLYNILIRPFEESLEGKRLIIVPDGRLGYLPFETLVSNLPNFERIDYRSLNYLIRKHPISYSYSSTLLYRNYEDPDYSMDLMALAPEYGPYNTDSISQLASRGELFMPLMNAVAEVERISELYNGDVYTNSEASETKFKEVASDYDIIHLAMHTVIDDERPMYSKLVFSNTKDTLNDRYLNTYELYGLELKAKMVVLSACNTGGGKIEEGEGIMSLARGFIYSGIPSIIMTLWEVEDKSGADIMTLFYENLHDGMSKDVALQQAKLAYLESATMLRSHPYFWLAYVDIGNTKPFKIHPLRSGINIGIGALIIILLALLIRYRHKKSRLM